MFLIRLFRFISGYVIFKGSGGFPERFINLCTLNGINLWDARATSGLLTAKTSIKCYKKIRTCAKKSGMKIRISSKCGLPFIMRPYIKRKGLLAGVILSAVALVYLTSAVWTIDVQGNERFTEDQIIEIAERYGVFSGVLKSSIDLEDVRTAIKSEIDGISWFSVNTDGCHVTLLVSETEGSTEIIDTETPCNIVSSIDGEVLSINIQCGTAAIEQGSALAKGDLIISGVVEKTDGSVSFCHARGDAVIRTSGSCSATVPVNLPAVCAEKIKKVFSISFFGLRIPLGSCSDMNLFRSDEKYLQFRNRILPVGIICDSYIGNIEETKNLSQNESALLASYILFVQQKEIMQDAYAEKIFVQMNINNNYAEAVYDYIIHKTTGIEYYFEVTD